MSLPPVEPVLDAPSVVDPARERAPGRPSVLVVEDSSDRRALFRSALESGGFEVVEARDGLDAMRRTEQQRPDLVLLDRNLPYLDGCELARRLREQPALAKVPLVAHGPAGDRSRCLAAGCDGYVDEPLDPGQLAPLVREYLGGRRDDVTRTPSAAERATAAEREVLELSGANERLREELRARIEFMQNLAHELATPLTPLVGYLRLLRSGRLGDLSDKQRQVLDAMSHATERIEHSIDNLVDFAAIETGQYRVHSAAFDAAAMLEEVVAQLHPKGRAKHVRLDARHPPQAPLVADERKVRQALANILDNALRHSPHGGHVLVVLSETPTRTEFAVYDQGPGMSLDAQKALVAPKDERSSGAGLGLPVARRIADAHGGELVIESPPKEQPETRDLFSGTKVVFWIPKPAANP